MAARTLLSGSVIITILIWVWQVNLFRVTGEEPRLEKAQALLKQGDEFAKANDLAKALAAYVDAYQIIVASIRQRPFLSPVDVNYQKRDELRRILQEQIEKGDLEGLHHTEVLYRVMGFLAQDRSLRQSMVQLLGSQVAGYYDSSNKKLRLILENSGSSFIRRLLLGSSLGLSEQKTTLAHELTHALADQHYDLDSLAGAFRYQDDYTLAIDSLVEGDAMLVTLAEMMEDHTGKAVLDMSAQAESLVSQLPTSAQFYSRWALSGYPPVLRDALVIPYTSGTVFALQLLNKNSWRGVDEAFLQPPVSMEQILNPERYIEERDDPLWIELPELDRYVADAGWRSEGRNTLGEFYIRVLFRKLADHVGIAYGWDGDRCEVFQRPNKEAAFVWLTTWDSPHDAREFARGASQWFDAHLSHYVTGKEGLAIPARPRLEELKQWWEVAEVRRWDRVENDRAVVVELRQQDVAVVFGFDPARSDLLIDQLFRSQKAPWRLTRRISPTSQSQ